MITELMTQPVVLNTKKQGIHYFFMAPWSVYPNMTLKEYVRQLDKRQRAAKTKAVVISDEDKTTHFVGCTEVSGLFKDEWATDWKATSDKIWTVVCNFWVGKWLEVTRAETMAANLGGYESTAALRGTRETLALISLPITVTKAEYDAVSEYDTHVYIVTTNSTNRRTVGAIALSPAN